MLSIKAARTVLFFLLISGGIFSCTNESDENEIEIPCPAEIKKLAFYYAEQYEKADTEYKWGGQDLLRTIKIDCSGLVINCYQYALQDSRKEYKLIQPDMSSAYMHSDASFPTDSPETGDLIFMGEENSSSITHIALFEKFEGEEAYFIDSTKKSGIDGVSRRHYPKDDRRIKSYGIMKLRK